MNKKQLHTLAAEFDRDGSFESQLIKKNQTLVTGMDEQIIALYAKGLSNQEIVEMFKELYDADVSTSLIINAVYPQSDIYDECSGIA